MASATLWAYACGDGTTEPPPLPPDPPRPTTVTVSPATAELTALGATVQLSAEVRDQNGQVMAGATVTWASSAAAVATVGASGLVTAVANGGATITATSGAASGSATVSVAQEVSAVAVVPAEASLAALGDTLRLTAEAFDANGNAVAGAEFLWESSDAAVATVDATGLVAAVASGSATITATAGDASGSATVTVAQEVSAVAVVPDTATVVVGDTLRLAATATDANGQVVTGVAFAWASGDTAVAVVDASGLLTGVGAGQAQVTATAAGVTGRAQLTVVAPVPAVVAVTPDTVVLTAVGQTAQLTAEVRDQLGRVMDGVPVAWSSGDTAVAVVDSAGLVSAVGDGAATITARAGEASGEALVTVTTATNLDRAALVAFYNATDGPNWVNNENWLTDAPLQEWYGVRTNAVGRVVRIDLAGRYDNEARQFAFHGLRGKLPIELAGLTELRWLNLSFNSLTGPIAPELGNLAELSWVDLGNNDLTGPIPPELGNLAELSGLRLGNNDLTGRIPPELGMLAKLIRLNLSSNNLTGPIPPELGNLVELRWVFLRGNNLTGPIPPGLGNLANLTSLDLYANNLTGPIPLELGDLAKLEELYLRYNNLTGPIPPELGNLTNLRRLFLGYNDLTGPIPQNFLQLDQLRRLDFIGQYVCVPGTSTFVAWLEGVDGDDPGPGDFCNAADVVALKSLYDRTDGVGWTETGGWLDNDPVEEWYGVTADSLGHVTELDLEGNGLTGHLSATLGNMARLTRLRIADNALTGRLPGTLTGLPLVEFRYSETELCAPDETFFKTWLSAIASIEGTGLTCGLLSDRDILEIFYDATGGTNWTHQDNWLTDAPLRNWHGVDVGGEGRVSGLKLDSNNLSGRIPPELGNLTELTRLELWTNHLTGRIPPGLGNLAELKKLTLGYNDLTGPIPPELGDLAVLNSLSLDFNNLTGRIPRELGNLTPLTRLELDSNNLTGPIPPELGDLANLIFLDLASNSLSGSVPSQLGGLTNLRELALANNPGLAGALPQSLTKLVRLEELLASGTGLCAPPDSDFRGWLDKVYNRWITPCVEGAPSAAYLTQAVQSREFPVPLVAGEKALLRVFPTSGQVTGEGIPSVRARFYRGGQETHVQDIPGKSDPIPTEVDEGDLSRSANAEIPGSVIQPGLEMVIEVDPDATRDLGLGVAKRIPETGRLAVDVKAMPQFDLTLIPFILSGAQDSSIVDLVGAMAADPEHHELFGRTRTLLPIGALAVTAHEPVLGSANNALMLINQTRVIRVMEGATGHYMGLLPTRFGGFGDLGGRSSVAGASEFTIAHELGHNLNLGHATCGATIFLDSSYPNADGSGGAWGYDFRDGGRLVHPSTPDMMSYCVPQWIGNYHFTNALRYRLFDEGSAAAAASASTRSLLLWGGVGADSVPYLEPAFVIDAPPALPGSAGEYRVTGRTAGGGQLFSLSFTMPVTADGDGSSGFAFALPVRAGWEDRLAAITLTGPKGSVTLDGESDIPMAILRDPRTGQVRGILRDHPLATEVAADAIGVSAPGLEVLFSRGMPGGGAWRR